MNLPNSFAVSLFVWIAILGNGLVFFRFNPFKYWKEILLISIFTSSISVILQYMHWIGLITFIPPLFALSFFSVLTGFSWIHALTMVIVGFTVNGLLEFGVTYVFSGYDIALTLTNLANDYSLEAWYFVGLHLLLVVWLYHSRIGFTTLKKNQRPRMNDKLVYFIFVFLFINSIAGLVIVFRGKDVLLYVLLLFLLFIAYTVINYVRELKED